MSYHTTSTTNRRTNAELYEALSKGDDVKVCEICRELPDGPFHILTIHDDSVLHIACYYKHNNLVLQLINQLPQDQHNKLTIKNGAGNTLLHATATNNKTVGAATELLRRAPSLLAMTDNLGETALFRAARYGKTKFFCFLEDQVSRKSPTESDLRTFLFRDDKATMLHVAVHSENFESALKIAETYPILIDERDGDGMTALQLLACKPSAFASVFKDDHFKRFIYKFINSSPKEGYSRVPIVKKVQKQMLKRESAKKVGTFLIESDASWEATEPMSNQNRIKLHRFGAIAHAYIIINAPIPDSPLFLATKSGCTEIVKEILQYPLTRLRGKIDKRGNSILHMVGTKVRNQKAESDIRSPALVLRDDLLLFESVKNICTTLTKLQVNNDGVTAEQLFIENNAQLRVDAKEWMKSTAENCSIVAVLIATVAFAAAYTVPGGPNQTTGYPLLKDQPFFIVFALADALSLTFSLTSVIIFLSILTSSFRLKDFKTTLHNKLLLGLTVLILSVSMMMVAFAATLILIISSKQDWTNILLYYIISFFPVTVFVCSTQERPLKLELPVSPD
ncbi:ankyrin repeat-containing protein [Tanacetum coccineum]